MTVDEWLAFLSLALALAGLFLVLKKARDEWRHKRAMREHYLRYPFANWGYFWGDEGSSQSETVDTCEE